MLFEVGGFGFETETGVDLRGSRIVLGCLSPLVQLGQYVTDALLTFGNCAVDAEVEVRIQCPSIVVVGMLELLPACCDDTEVVGALSHPVQVTEMDIEGVGVAEIGCGLVVSPVSDVVDGGGEQSVGGLVDVLGGGFGIVGGGQESSSTWMVWDVARNKERRRPRRGRTSSPWSG